MSPEICCFFTWLALSRKIQERKRRSDRGQKERKRGQGKKERGDEEDTRRGETEAERSEGTNEDRERESELEELFFFLCAYLISLSYVHCLNIIL